MCAAADRRGDPVERPSLSVVIPAHNESGHLRPHLAALVPILRVVAPDRWEVILVDDGSTDATWEEICELADGKSIRGIHFARNRGKGAAVRAGVLASRGDAVLLCDADMATPPDELRAFAAELGRGADVVIGNRRSPLARIGRPQPLRRRWLGAGYVALARLLVGAPLHDVNCGFKLFEGALARDLFRRARSQRWTFDVEVLALAVREGRIVREVPVQWNQGGRSSVALARDIARTSWDLIGLWLQLRRPR